MELDYHHMDQILPAFWIGDLHSARDSDTLRANNIRSILSVMRGTFSVHDVRLTFLVLIYDSKYR
jgi:dual specificity phosphatase 12